MRILPIVGALLTSAVLIIVGAGGAVLYGHSSTQEQTITAASEPVERQRETPRAGAEEIALETIRQLLGLIDGERRAAILESTENFSNFVKQERANQAVLTAAYANSADRNDAVSTLMLRASQKVLAEAYLTQVVKRNLDADFPSEDQTREFYASNKEAFRLPDRLHMWQIFIPAAAESSDLARNNARALATQVAAGLRSGKTEFAEAAAKHSKHLQSRVNDGYMGLLKTDDLLPEVRTAVDKLKPETVSTPVQSNAGFHIIKRGALVIGTQLDYAAVQPRIVAQLRREAGNRVRQAAVQKIMETYPVTVEETALEDWLASLQSAEWPRANQSSASQ